MLKGKRMAQRESEVRDNSYSQLLQVLTSLLVYRVRG